jgi:hypothetical protein
LESAIAYPKSMREIGEENLGLRTLSEVKDATFRVERIGKKAGILMAGGKNGRKAATQAAVISALILWLESQPQDMIESVLADGMARLNALMEGTGGPPAPARHEAPPEPAPYSQGRQITPPASVPAPAPSPRERQRKA